MRILGPPGFQVSPTKITTFGTDCRILMFTMHESDSLGKEARNAGAQGVVLKSQAARNLIVAIETVLGGGTFFELPVKT